MKEKLIYYIQFSFVALWHNHDCEKESQNNKQQRRKREKTVK